MGQTLSEPIVEKHSDSKESSRIIFGASSMQGWRITMEDAHCCHLELKSGSDSSAAETSSLFGVFDGHGGASVAKYCGQNIHEFIVNSDHYRSKDYAAALRQSLLEIDTKLKANPSEMRNESSGSTAVVALVTPAFELIAANVGDSRIVLSANGEAIPLSTDHKPTVAAETARIRQAGGFVEAGRVNGALALSRAVGDFEYKKNANLGPEAQMVTAYCDITERKLTPEDEFIVMACDGIWDCLTNQQVVNYIRTKIALGWSLDKICEALMDRCLAPNSNASGVGCDNMTLLIAGFLQDKSKEDWIAQCSKKSIFMTPENTVLDREPSNHSMNGSASK